MIYHPDGSPCTTYSAQFFNGIFLLEHGGYCFASAAQATEYRRRFSSVPISECIIEGIEYKDKTYYQMNPKPSYVPPKPYSAT